MKKVLNNDEYTVVRGVPVRKEFLKKMALEMSAKPVTDLDLIQKLDKEYRRYNATHAIPLQNPHNNDAITMVSEPNKRFKPIVFPIDLSLIFEGLEMTTNDSTRPVWFSLPRIHVIRGKINV